MFINQEEQQKQLQLLSKVPWDGNNKKGIYSIVWCRLQLNVKIMKWIWMKLGALNWVIDGTSIVSKKKTSKRISFEDIDKEEKKKKGLSTVV